MAIAPIRPLAWEPPYATAVAQEMAKRQKTKKKTKTKKQIRSMLISNNNNNNNQPYNNAYFAADADLSILDKVPH